MAYIWAHGKRLAIRFRVRGVAYKTTVPLTPTKSNRQSLKARAREYEARLISGERWEDIKAELRGEQHFRTSSLGHYMQVALDIAEIEETTRTKYAETFNRVWGRFVDRPVGSVTKTELRSHLATFNYSAKMRKNAISVLRRAYEAAKDDEVIDSAPTDHWKVGKEQRPRKDPYTPEERDALLNELSGVGLAFFSVAFYSGMRTGELLALQPKHLKRPFITVEQEFTEKKLVQRTKTKEIRDAHLTSHVWPLIEPYRFQKWLFLNEWDRPFTHAQPLLDELRAAADRAGVRYREGRYPWRSSYVSHMLMAGIHPGEVAHRTGHNEQTMWTHYAEFIPSNKGVDAFEEAMRPKRGPKNEKDKGK